MHPVIRISLFLIFCFYIVQAKPGQLLLAGFILFSASIFQQKKYIILMWNMIWRLKWFYISIFLLFSLLTPNTFTETTENLPNYISWLNPGIYYSVIKVIALMLIVVAVIVFIVSIPRDKLIATLIYLSKPLSLFGFSSERFAVRIYLIIEFVEDLPMLIKRKKDTTAYKSKITEIVTSMSHVLDEIYYRAENSECEKIQYDNMTLPHFYQWGYLLLSIVLFYLSDRIFINLVL